MKTAPKNTRVRHGQAACADYGCKRVECLAARRNRQKRNKYLATQGRPGIVRGDRVAAHIRRLRETGLADEAIRDHARLGRGAFYRAAAGEDVTRSTESRLLAIPIPAGVIAGPGSRATTDAVGTVRRLRALIWAGWPAAYLSVRLGAHDCWVGKTLRAERVSVARAVQVKELYDLLWDRQPQVAGVRERDVAVAQQIAERYGWAPPLAWDDDTIDDPSAVPQLDVARQGSVGGERAVARFLAGEAVVLNAQGRRDVIAHLMEWSAMSPAQVAARVGVTVRAMERVWGDLRREAAAEGRVLERRVWIPPVRDRQDKTSKQDEMGVAA